MDFTNFAREINESLRGAKSAFEKLAETVPKKADKPGMIKDKKKTQKGAMHVVNPTFRSRQILAVTPAQYRRRHLGSMKKVIANGS